MIAKNLLYVSSNFLNAVADPPFRRKETMYFLLETSKGTSNLCSVTEINELIKNETGHLR